MTHDLKVESAALEWVVRQRDPDFVDWEVFADWLAEDAAHAQAYHELAALDADLVELPAEPEAIDTAAPDEATDNVVPLAPRRASRRLWLSGALAASLVAMVSIGVMQRAPDEYRIDTAMGETELVTLGDGSKIAVNGGSSVVLSKADPRKAVLERGQVLFTVVHRDEAPFRVTVGGAELVDVGTVFDVTRTDGQTVVAVSEGAVVYNPTEQNVRVDAGHRLSFSDDGARSDLRTNNNEGVGGWQSGQLIYDGVPLRDVAEEISRTTGIRLRTGPGASTILFRGALQAGNDSARLVSDLAALSGTRATQDAGGWTLSR